MLPGFVYRKLTPCVWHIRQTIKLAGHIIRTALAKHRKNFARNTCKTQNQHVYLQSKTKPASMKLTYIYHSCYVIEGRQSTVIIDFYRDSNSRYLHRKLPSFPGPLYVLASHWHLDHFNRSVLNWIVIHPDTHYIFSGDIFGKRLHSTAPHISFIRKGDTWEDENIRIKAFGSTDVGISFLIDMEGKTFFHAGDLNNWHWDEESTQEEILQADRSFLDEVASLQHEAPRLDLAMFPIDHRLGKNYMRGAEQFVDRIHVDRFAPMHFGDDFASVAAFRPYAENAGCRFAAWKKSGQHLIF
jgi:L-ascorbate metabolism protein UlaG (beta-lactamase superfamily)